MSWIRKVFTRTFRRVNSPEALTKIVKFLTDDVIVHGGSASETINMHGELWEITVCKVPWGTLLLKRPTTELEAALAWAVALSEEANESQKD